jgi:NAD+ kinase
MSAFKSIGLVGKHADPSVAPTLKRLTEQLRRHGCEVLLDESCRDYLPDAGVSCLPRWEMVRRCDLVVAVGGDGTLLNTGRDMAPHGVPILGINQGRLGFLVDVLPAEMPATVEEVLAGHYIREDRLMLNLVIEKVDESLGPFQALNEVVVHSREFARLLEFDTQMDNSFISHHRADGMIVASPTGSTAYALSGGGPVLHPAMEAVVLVPICPHTLSDRPIVVDGNAEIVIHIREHSAAQALATCDGQASWALQAGDRLRVSRTEKSLRLIHPPSYDYFRILRSKLNWGRGQASFDDETNNEAQSPRERSC